MEKKDYEALAEQYLDLYMGGFMKDYFLAHEKESIRNFAIWLNRESDREEAGGTEEKT